jgi:hypothetical protein
MYLYDRPSFELIYCMVSTDPQNDFGLLNQWDNMSLHRVDHIDAAKRITVIRYERDIELELAMLERLRHASEFYVQYINKLNNK